MQFTISIWQACETLSLSRTVYCYQPDMLRDEPDGHKLGLHVRDLVSHLTQCRGGALDRWKQRYTSAIDAYVLAKEMFERTKKTGDIVLITNAENTFKECEKEKSKLDIFKKDLGSFVRFYEFMSQIVDYDDKNLEKLSLFARHLRPLLHEQRIEEDEIDLSNVEMSHYRLSKLHE